MKAIVSDGSSSAPRASPNAIAACLTPRTKEASRWPCRWPAATAASSRTRWPSNCRRCVPRCTAGANGTIRCMTDRAQPEAREAYRHFRRLSTRWMDNDVYGHLNNVVYYSLFDTAVNGYLIDAGALDIQHSEVIGLVV